MRVRRILLEEHEERLKRNKCPRCNNFSLQKINVKDCSNPPKTKFKLSDYFWSCGGPEAFKCYFISSDLGSTLFESSEGVEIIDFNIGSQPKYTGGKIVKRLKTGECIELKPLLLLKNL